MASRGTRRRAPAADLFHFPPTPPREAPDQEGRRRGASCAPLNPAPPMDPSPSALQLEVASEEIRASYQPAGDAPPPSRADLQQALSERGLQDCVFDEAAIWATFEALAPAGWKRE